MNFSLDNSTVSMAIFWLWYLYSVREYYSKEILVYLDTKKKGGFFYSQVA